MSPRAFIIRPASIKSVLKSAETRLFQCLAQLYFQRTLALLPLQPLHESSGPFLWRHVEGDAGELAVDVERTLQLEEVPVLHDHLGLCPRHPMLQKRSI